ARGRAGRSILARRCPRPHPSFRRLDPVRRTPRAGVPRVRSAGSAPRSGRSGGGFRNLRSALRAARLLGEFLVEKALAVTQEASRPGMRDTSKADGSAVRPNEQKLNTARSLGLSLLEAACIAVRAAGPGTVERAAADARIRELIAE